MESRLHVVGIFNSIWFEFIIKRYCLREKKNRKQQKEFNYPLVKSQECYKEGHATNISDYWEQIQLNRNR